MRFPQTKRKTDSLETRMRQCMAMIEKAARNNQRAPTRDELLSAIPGGGPALTAIVKAGWVESRWYGKNYRVFYILRGECEGMHTLLPPDHYHESTVSQRKRGAL